MKKKSFWRPVIAFGCAAALTCPAAAFAASPSQASFQAAPFAMACSSIHPCIPAMPAGDSSTITGVMTTGSEGEDTLVIEGEIGDCIVSGGLIFKIASPEEVEKAVSAPQARDSFQRWNINLSGDSLNKGFEAASTYPYAKVWISNTGSASLVFTITKDSPVGAVVPGGTAIVPAGTSCYVYSPNPLSPAMYYANFTSGKADMAGTAACRQASTFLELDF